MNYMPEDSYHHQGQSPYADQNPYSGMNGGPGSVHSSRVSLHSNSSNRPRQVEFFVALAAVLYQGPIEESIKLFINFTCLPASSLEFLLFTLLP